MQCHYRSLDGVLWHMSDVLFFQPCMCKPADKADSLCSTDARMHAKYLEYVSSHGRLTSFFSKLLDDTEDCPAHSNPWLMHAGACCSCSR